MSKIRLTDLLQNKKVGERWPSLQAPEELHRWLFDVGWNVAAIKEKYDVALLAFAAKASGSTGVNIQRRYTRAAPLVLQCGERIVSGSESIAQNIKRRIYHMVDGFSEVNDILKDASEYSGIVLKNWEIIKLEIFNKKNGITTTFSKHNPDGTGAFLYTWCFSSDDMGEKLYPDVPLFEQQRAVGNFSGIIAACELTKRVTISPDCVLKTHKEIKKYLRTTKTTVGPAQKLPDITA